MAINTNTAPHAKQHTGKTQLQTDNAFSWKFGGLVDLPPRGRQGRWTENTRRGGAEHTGDAEGGGWVEGGTRLARDREAPGPVRPVLQTDGNMIFVHPWQYEGAKTAPCRIAEMKHFRFYVMSSESLDYLEQEP